MRKGKEYASLSIDVDDDRRTDQGVLVALAQTTTTVVTKRRYPVDLLLDLLQAPTTSRRRRWQAAQILTSAGYQNPTGLSLGGDVWTGKATMNNHQVSVRFDRERHLAADAVASAEATALPLGPWLQHS
jgi:hypothetical protein